MTLFRPEKTLAILPDLCYHYAGLLTTSSH